MQNLQFTPPRCIPMSEAVFMTGLSKSTLYALLADKASDLPRPIKIGRRTYFIQSEIDAWIASRPRLKVAAERKEVR